VRPLTGSRFRKLARLVEADCGLYSAHLPLDSHPELGNCVLLALALGVEVEGRFGTHDGADIGWRGRVARQGRQELRAAVAEAVGGSVRLLAGGREEVETVGVITGGGGSLIEEAVRAGLDAFVTGEGSHHTYVEAMEMGINVYYGGHYATETFGVKALAAHLAERFSLTWEFLDFPSGL
jgi:dinuclear metal center YbgI/SA1388 family protein